MSQGSEVPCKSGWVLDELATTGRENLDPVHASQYDRKEDARAAEEVQLLVDLASIRQRDVVDLGAGTGQFAVAAADVSNRVIAVDVSEVMLTRLRAKTGKVTEAGISNIEVVTPASSPTATRDGQQTSSTRAGRSTRSPISGSPSHWSGCAGRFGREACFGCRTSSTPSTVRRPRTGSRHGPPAHLSPSWGRSSGSHRHPAVSARRCGAADLLSPDPARARLLEPPTARP